MASRFVTPHRTAAEVETGHFDMRRGYGAWRPRGTEDWLLIYTVSGRGRFGYGTGGGTSGGERVAESGEITLLRPGTPHDYGVESTLQHWELLWAHFIPRPHWHDLLAWPAWAAAAPGLMHLPIPDEAARAKILSRLFDMHRLATGVLRRPRAFAMNALEEALLWCDAHNPAAHALPVDERLRLAMERAVAGMGEKLTVAALADFAGLSESHFAHLFRETIGVAPLQWVERTRLTRARQLLELTAMPVKQVAREVGYDDPLYFSKRFAAFAGKSPRAYRETIRGRRGGET